jgi:hypothetical protein
VPPFTEIRVVRRREKGKLDNNLSAFFRILRVFSLPFAFPGVVIEFKEIHQ